MVFRFLVIFVLGSVATVLYGQGQTSKKPPAKKASAVVSFEKDVFPIIEKQCLPCHAEENFNPSELSLDTYELLMSGGKSGASVVPGKSEESHLVQKLGKEPPFGDRMPLNTKKTIASGKAKWLTDEEIKLIATWIDQGAKDN